MKAGIRGVPAAIVIGLGVWAWWHFQPQDLPDGFAAGNGRIEAVEIDIAASAIFVDPHLKLYLTHEPQQLG